MEVSRQLRYQWFSSGTWPGFDQLQNVINSQTAHTRKVWVRRGPGSVRWKSMGGAHYRYGLFYALLVFLNTESSENGSKSCAMCGYYFVNTDWAL